MSLGAAPEPDRLAAESRLYLSYAATERSVGARTLENYRRDIEQFTAFLREQSVVSCEEVTRPLLRRWLSSLRQLGVTTPSMVRRAREVRAFLRFLAGARGDESDPFAGLHLPKAAGSTPRTLTQSEVARLLAAPAATPLGLRDRAVMEVLYSTGLKITDLVQLDVRQVNLAAREIVRWDRGGRARSAFLGGSAVAALEGYLVASRPALLGERSERALFLSRRAGRLSVRAVEQIVARNARAAGVTATPRDLRIACAAHLREGGASARLVRQLLGTTRSKVGSSATDKESPIDSSAGR